MMRSFRVLPFLACAALITATSVAATPLGTGFTYQGKIQKSGQPYSGTAALIIRLYDSVTGGTQIGPDANLPSVTVTGGLFTAELDFGAGAFNGDARWLEIQVETSGDSGYTLLTPRQKVTATPYSLNAVTGGTGGSQWVSNGPDLTYPGGSVGVTGASSPFASGKGVFFEGGNSNWANVWAFNYDTLTPLTLLLNAPGGKVAVNTTNPIGEFTSVSSGDAAIVGQHTGSWIGVYGESAAYAGVYGKSVGGTGVVGDGGGAYNAGVTGYADNALGWGGYFKNTAGGVALLSDGKAVTRSLDIVGGADIVEGFETGSKTLEPGTVVVIDSDHPGELRASRVAYDTRVAGVVSGAGGIAPGLKLTQKGALDGNTPVAMTGRVYVRCSAENGPIRPGDLLTTAGKAGCAMRASDPSRSYGAVIGKAMSSLESGTGLVLVLVNLQ